MMTIVVFFLTAVAALVSIVVPWTGVLVYYLLGVGQPQGYFPWVFDATRSSLIITATTLLGLMIAIATRKIDLRVLLSKQSILIMLMAIWVNLAESYSAFNNSGVIDYAFEGLHSSEFIISNFNKIVIFYFAAVLLIDDRRKLILMFVVFLAVVIAYTIWANKIYLTQTWFYFGDNGRLGAPYKSMYRDENMLGMLFVLGTPILYYLGAMSKYPSVKYGLWAITPLCWHALFLTGTRGGLLALGAVCIYIGLRSYNKLASIGVVVGLILAILLQGGFLLNRVDTTVEAAEVEESEKALDPRLIAWGAGFEMIKDYPMFGVGAGNFINAYQRYSDTKPHVAHNTFLQFAADNGLITGLIFLYLFLSQIFTFFTRKRVHKRGREGLEENYLNDMITAMCVGFFVVAIFLNLMLYEVMWFLLVVSYCQRRLENPFRISILRVDVDKSIYERKTGKSIYASQTEDK